MIIFNGVRYESIEELELAMSNANITETQKDFIRNDFNGVPNTPIESLVASTVTNQQLKQALILKSFNESKPSLHPDAIESFLKTLPEPHRSLALNYWNQSNEMLRNNLMLSQLAPMLGLTNQDLDNLWNFAKTLN
jgi:hypothetical protein